MTKRVVSRVTHWWQEVQLSACSVNGNRYDWAHDQHMTRSMINAWQETCSEANDIVYFLSSFQPTVLQLLFQVQHAVQQLFQALACCTVITSCRPKSACYTCSANLYDVSCCKPSRRATNL